MKKMGNMTQTGIPDVTQGISDRPKSQIWLFSTGTDPVLSLFRDPGQEKLAQNLWGTGTQVRKDSMEKVTQLYLNMN